MHVVVASSNPVKINAARDACRQCFEELQGVPVHVQGVAVSSGVQDQPWGDAETLQVAHTGRSTLA